jgi:hypothetical protein
MAYAEAYEAKLEQYRIALGNAKSPREVRK